MLSRGSLAASRGHFSNNDLYHLRPSLLRVSVIVASSDQLSGVTVVYQVAEENPQWI